MTEAEQATWAARQAAAMLVEALQLTEPVATIADELTLVDITPVQTTFAAEFDSSAGRAAFLIYVFALGGNAVPGNEAGRAEFESALATLETAAARGAPGPRVVAHLLTDEAGLILATSPAVLRSLQGEPAAPTAPTWPTPAARDRQRREQAERLLRSLRAADRAAERWLAAAGEQPVAIPAEIELALFVHDEGSISHLLQAINRLLAPSPGAGTDA